jgi:dienelactone hydrolase
MRVAYWSFVLLVVGGLTAAFPGRTEATTGPWNIANLQQPPVVSWVDESGVLRRLFYINEPVNGNPTRVFAYYAQPAAAKGKIPGIVLVHGGGGRAFPDWATMWAKRGYAALAMDLNGCGPDGTRLPDGGPSMGGAMLIPAQPIPLNDAWSYHAVAAVIRGVSLLCSLPQVNPSLVSVHGVSWGGYVTCIVAGLDARVRAAVPVYGCGFLREDSAWSQNLAGLPPAWRATWLANFDPLVYLPQAQMPMLFVTGANDPYYPLGSLQRSSQLVQKHQLSIINGLAHGHPSAWARPEPGVFIDEHSKKTIPLPTLNLQMSLQLQEAVVVVPQTVTVNQRRVVVQRQVTNLTVSVASTYRTTIPLTAATAFWTYDVGPWPSRRWLSAPAAVVGGQVVAQVPANQPVSFYLAITDRRGVTVSTEVSSAAGH